MAKKKQKLADVKQDLVSGVYLFREFRAHKVTAAFSGRRYKMNFTPTGSKPVVIASRKHFCDLMGVPFERMVCLEQVHGANIVRVMPGDAGRGAKSQEETIPGCDAAITNDKTVVLSVRTADCAPVFFMDPVKRAIGLAHIGWRGGLHDLAAKMVQAMRIQFLSKPENILVAIGPMIRSCCYEVGQEFQKEFKAFCQKRKNGFYLNLTGKILNGLKAQGILESHIFDSGICTVCENKRFPSYRKEGPEFRPILSVIAFRKKRSKHAGK